MPKWRGFPELLSDPIDAAAFDCRRFWVTRGTAPNLSDQGYLVDPELRLLIDPPGVPFDALAEFPVLGLLGEPGMGKTTVVKQEARRLKDTSQENGEQVLRIDLAAFGTDVLVYRRVFQSKEMKSLRRSNVRLHLFLDGFDTCLHHVENLVALLLDGLHEQPRDRLSLRIACRTADWPPDLEDGLAKLWQKEEQAVGIFELAPLRQKDVRAVAEAAGLPAAEFLSTVENLGAAQFANRPITLRFLLNTFRAGKGLPQRRTDLYREGCLVLCDEWRPDLRRGRRPKLSSGMRFAVAGRLAAVSVFARKTALWTASRQDITPQEDVRIDELLGGEEHFGREGTEVLPDVVTETLQTSLFRSVGPHRTGFSHQTYAEFLAAQYLVDHAVDVPRILRLLLHPDGSDKVVSQLRETAAWLAALVPAVSSQILEKDPFVLFASDTPLASEEDRRILVRQILRLFDSGELFDIELIAAAGRHENGARLKFAGIAKDLRPYIVDKSKRSIVRHAAVLMALYTQQVELEHDLLCTALDDGEGQDVRVAAAVAIRMIGHESSKAALKPLVTIPASSDPGDELKGAGLAATWPKHLTAEELFTALTPPRKPTGEYQSFLESDFAVHLRCSDMIRALQWARSHSTTARAEFDVLGRAAVSVVIAAIDCFHDVRVCDSVGEILVQIAQKPAPVLQLMIKLSSHRDARTAIARVAIRVSPDLWTLRCLKSYGLVEDGDVPLLLAELDTVPARDRQEAISLLIADILHGATSFDAELIEQVLAAARANPVLSAALKPVFAPVELGSEEAKRQQELYKNGQRQNDPAPKLQPAPDPEDLVGVVDSRDALAFVDICYRLAGTSWYPDEEVLPGWEKLKPALQAQIIRSAETYLNGYCVASTSWIDTGEIWYNVTCGYWALRLLAQKAPDILHGLSGDVWHVWMPSVFGDSYMHQVPDAVQTAILRAAYRRAPARFRELLSRFVDGQNKRSGEVFVLDLVAPVWDTEIANILRTRLEDDSFGPGAFRSILSALLKAGDEAAVRIATDLVAAANDASPAVIERSVQAALEMLDNDPTAGWQVIWPVAKTNYAMAERLLGSLALDPYSSSTTRVLEGLRENDLAELQIWLFQHHSKREGAGGSEEEVHKAGPFTEITLSAKWHWLGVAIVNNLIERATPAAAEAIRKIKEAFPNENLDRVEKVAEELIRQKTWTPLTPSEFLDFALTSTRSRSAVSSPAISESPPPPIAVEAVSGERKLTEMRIRRCDPRLWRNFSYEKTSRTSTFRELLIHHFVRLSVPKPCTNRDVVKQIARDSHIPVESLCDDLNQPVFTRGRPIFGYAGDEFDQIADNYDNMQWWLSDAGLNMAIVSPAGPGPSIPTLDELFGGRMLDTSGVPGSVRPESDSARVPLPVLLREAEIRTEDPKLRNKLLAVLRYSRYFEDLKVLKTACKRYQTPALLEQQFPDLDVWAPLDDADKADIANGEFLPGRFAWALVLRWLNLKGKDNRTLKNYRKALRTAGLLN